MISKTHKFIVARVRKYRRKYKMRAKNQAIGINGVTTMENQVKIN